MPTTGRSRVSSSSEHSELPQELRALSHRKLRNRHWYRCTLCVCVCVCGWVGEGGVGVCEMCSICEHTCTCVQCMCTHVCMHYVCIYIWCNACAESECACFRIRVPDRKNAFSHVLVVLNQERYVFCCWGGPERAPHYRGLRDHVHRPTDRVCPIHVILIRCTCPRCQAAMPHSCMFDMWIVQCVVEIATRLRMPTMGKRKAETPAQRTARLERERDQRTSLVGVAMHPWVFTMDNILLTWIGNAVYYYALKLVTQSLLRDVTMIYGTKLRKLC